MRVSLNPNARKKLEILVREVADEAFERGVAPVEEEGWDAQVHCQSKIGEFPDWVE